MAEPGGVAASLLGQCTVPSGDVVVALSGGADSAVAAWVAQRLATGRVRALFVMHGLPASPLMRDAADEVARHLGLDLEQLEVFVPEGPSHEEQLRVARLGALETYSGDDWIITGHTADDRAETVLLNLLRGAGATGIASIRERRDRYVRPLINVRRSVVRHAATELGIPFVDDPANLDRAHARNRIRHELLPQLQAEWNPQVVDGLLRTAEACAADDELLEEMAGRLAPAGDRVPSAVLATAPDAVAARIVRRMLRAARSPAAPSAREVRAVRAVASGDTNRTALQDDWEALREGAYVVVARKAERRRPPGATLTVPDQRSWDGWSIRAEHVSGGPPVIIGSSRVLVDGSFSSFVVRGATEGDRIDMGATGRKRAFEALAEAGVAPHLRPGWPVVESDGRIVWLAGVRVAAWAVATGTDQILLSSRRESK